MKNTRARVSAVLATVLSTVMVTAALLSLNSTDAVAVVGATTISIDGQSRAVDGENVRRATNFLVVYSNVGTRTGTNEFGTEVAVVNGKVTQVQTSVGNMLVPANGYVLSGHGTSNTWLKARAQVGDTVLVNGNGGGGTPILPDIGIRTLRQFTIANPTTGQFAGRKLLKFPAVTANVGDGPLEIHGQRSTSTSTDWLGSQRVKNTDGTWTMLPPTPGATFVFGGDGHNHWHIKDFDEYELLNSGGTVIERGEKHGFCFEDNTGYRDWPGKGTNGTPSSPVYTPAQSCTVGQPQATQTLHGLSVGWSDTYPASLPDQAIDVTGLANGEYTVRVTADWQHLWAEKNEGNNSATARIRITGNSVTLLSATDGL
jgi:hypothetical protein